MTAATITDVMLPSFSIIVQEFAFQIETVVIRIGCTASGIDVHGAYLATPEQVGFLGLAVLLFLLG